MRPVRQQLRDMRQRAHHWPLTGARLAIDHVGGKSLDVLEDALHARLQPLGAFFGRHPISVAGLLERPEAIAYTESC